MKTENQETRKREIFEAAYRVLDQKGYKGTSMLGVAREAAASNETLYKWFKNKQGLLAAMVEENAHDVKELLTKALLNESDPQQTLEAFGPVLLRVLTSQRAVALNRAAAADVSAGGDLGRTIAANGRETVYPLVQKLFKQAARKGKIEKANTRTAADIYMSLLIGDIQIRRVIGVIDIPSEKQLRDRAAFATKMALGIGSASS